MSKTSFNFRMTAEWEPHEATWLSWPKDPNTFPPEIIEQVEGIYIRMIEELKKGEKIKLLVDDKATEEKVTLMLNDVENVIFYHIKSTDVWIRDYGPIFVLNRKKRNIVATKWIFNAWGNKYEDLKRDNETGIEIAKTTKYDILESGMVLEGGSIDTNGLGTCITTDQCLLNKNRNPNLDRTQIERRLRYYLGFTNFIWLKDGIEGDDTDGHVDDITRFVNERTVITMIEENKHDTNYEPLKRNLEILRNARDQDGKKLNIIPIPMPRKIEADRRRLPASYANFYIANSCVLLPIFNDENDEKAIAILRRFFPSKKIVGIPCEALVYGYGGIHCITNQEPKGYIETKQTLLL